MPGYLIQYNRTSGDWKVMEFPGENGHREALERRLQMESERLDPNWEIASLNSDSLETIKKTHARYFEGHELVDA